MRSEERLVDCGSEAGGSRWERLAAIGLSCDHARDGSDAHRGPLASDPLNPGPESLVCGWHAMQLPFAHGALFSSFKTHYRV
jgi:hypothetical protein